MYSNLANSIRPEVRMRNLLFLLTGVLFVSAILSAQSTPPQDGNPVIKNSAASTPNSAVAPQSDNSSADSILGDTVEITYRYPNVSTPYEGIGSMGVVTTTGVHLDLFNNVEVIVFPHSVEMTSINPNSSFTAADFNGVSVRDLTNPCAFPSAFATSNVLEESNIPGFSISDVSLIKGAMFVNYQSLVTPSGAIANVSFRVAPGCPADADSAEDGQ